MVSSVRKCERKPLVIGWKRNNCNHLRPIASVCGPVVIDISGKLKAGDVGWEVVAVFRQSRFKKLQHAGQLEQTPSCSEPSLDWDIYLSLPEDVSAEWKVAERKYHGKRGPAAGTTLPEWRSQSDIYVKVHELTQRRTWSHRQKWQNMREQKWQTGSISLSDKIPLLKRHKKLRQARLTCTLCHSLFTGWERLTDTLEYQLLALVLWHINFTALSTSGTHVPCQLFISHPHPPFGQCSGVHTVIRKHTNKMWASGFLLL